jgi:heme/copper-type cytochrome/quinol oxidase subunit 4
MTSGIVLAVLFTGLVVLVVAGGMWLMAHVAAQERERPGV